MPQSPGLESAGHADTCPFRMRLLGGLDVLSADGSAIGLPTRKSRMLAAYLALTAGQLHGRSKLATLFWEDHDEERARGSLRKALSALRSAFGQDAIIGDHEAVGMAPGLCATDVARLESLSRGKVGDWDSGDLERLSLSFLDGIDPEGDGLAEWLSFERTRCLALAQKVLGLAADQLSETGRGEEAIRLARRLLSLDPLREQSHRLLMTIHLRQGDRSLALACFRQCRSLVRSELGVEPSAETVRLAEEIAKADGASLAPPAEPAPASGNAFYKYSIAVLPFSNASDDPEQRYFAEGLAEDIIAELSRHKDLFVIARQSSFPFGAQPAGATDAARQLSVRYALTGTVRRQGDRIRVGVQLMDSTSQAGVWAERYDRQVGHIFDIQDEITAEVVAAIDAQIRFAERERSARARPDNLDAWELFHRGLWHAYNFTPDDTAAAARNFERAIDLAPDFALPHAGLGYLDILRAIWHQTDDPVTAIKRGLVHARTALSLDATSPLVQVVLGRLLTLAGDLDHAHDHLLFALKQNPNFAHAHYGLAIANLWSGRPADALESASRALRLSPREPLTSMYLTVASFSHFWLGNLPEAIESARSATRLQGRETWSRMALAAALVENGAIEEAEKTIREAQRIDPRLSLGSFFAIVSRTPPAIRDRVHLALRKAGLPE